jgi:ankyrin
MYLKVLVMMSRLQLKLGDNLQRPIAKANFSVLLSYLLRKPIYDLCWTAWNGALSPLSLPDYLAIGLNRYCHGSKKFSPLHLAVWNMHHGAVKVLLSNATTRLDSQTQPDWAPLHLAVLNNDVQMIRLLLHAGVDIEGVNEWGYTPMQWAAGSGLVAPIMALQRGGGDVKSEGRRIHPGALYERGLTPMHMAAGNERVKAIKLLQQLGVDVSIKSKDGWTPMHIAAEMGHCDVITVLKELGAEVSPRTNSGMTPLQIAKDQGQDKAVEMLIEAGAQF